MMKKKYISATLWNWNHKFFGRKLSGVYLDVRILFLPNCFFSFPFSAFASGGTGTLKNIVRESSSSGSAPSSWPFCSLGSGVPVDCRFSSPEVVRLCRLRIDIRLRRPSPPVTLCVAHRCRLTGFETLLSFVTGSAVLTSPPPNRITAIFNSDFSS